MRAVLLGLLILAALPVRATEWRGYVTAEYRGFAHAGLEPAQARGYASFAAQPEFWTEWQGGRQSLTITPFYRWDRFDRKRTRGDLRELLWLYVGRGLELRAGIGKVFWGVTETQHLVDVVNQIDLVESPDRKEKLGQPMAAATWLTAAGNWELYVLPLFRERTFPGEKGRLRTIPRVDTDQDALYESPRAARHVDAAARWTRTYGAWDIGLSQFYGTGREPRLVPGRDAGGAPVLRPYYGLLRQSGLEAQVTLERWLLKLEAVRRAGRDGVSRASTVGFEYTLLGAFGSAGDLGLLGEYLYDSLGPASRTPYQDDVMLGLRWSGNDVRGTRALAMLVFDRRSSERAFSLEASRRLGEHVRASVEARGFRSRAPSDPLSSVRRDDYVQLKLVYYF